VTRAHVRRQVIAGFICEFYGAPGDMGFGLGKEWDDAEQACVENFGGHLVSIHDQADYDRLATLTAGYTGPVLIGLYSDSAGNWQWKDGRPANMEFIMAHSYEPSQGDYGVGISNDATSGTKENQAAFHWPTHSSADGAGKGFQDWGNQNDGNAHAYACNAWGNCAVPTTECAPNAHCGTCTTWSVRHPTDLTNCPRPPRARKAPFAFPTVNRFAMALLYGRAGRLPGGNGGRRRWQA
jgi:hypothetical protein